MNRYTILSATRGVLAQNVAGAVLNENLKTMVLVMGGGNVESGHSFDDTITLFKTQLVALSHMGAVNPEFVTAIATDPATQKTFVVLVGGFKVESEHTLEETIDILNDKAIQQQDVPKGG